MKKINIQFDERSYPIYIGEGLISNYELISQHILGKKVAIITNETVADIYLKTLMDTVSSHKELISIILPDGESYKSKDSLDSIYAQLLENKADREITLIALGGGVIGDITGFAAATYMRGVNFIQIPTTLLSQVDSSVGGKTGINHPLGKNMIGAFYQPKCVISDMDVMKTLPSRELSAGLAEVIKYGLIRDNKFFEWLESHIQYLMEMNPKYLIEAVQRSCENKAAVVEADEFESGIRAILNLGHTFGHAIEVAQGYGNWLHGEAVGAGMVMAAKLSQSMGWLADKDVGRIVALIKKAGLPTEPPKISVKKYMELMMLDKKTKDGQINLVLQKSIGDAVLTNQYDPKKLHQILEQS
ncbi:MAG: 3-dehydroquinate synthase [Betaproteobacteria bacterium]|nr:3-dehydroquinate synthase [Betaproteobacteria bacterium]